MFLALLFFALAARDMYGKEYGAIAAILLLGCVHLQVTAHKLITDVALFAGFSIALYGFTLSTRRRTAGGFRIGTGTGIGFLSKGLLAPGVIGITDVALPVLFRQWRRKDYGVSFAVALAAVLPWVVIWPAALYRRSPDLFLEWFWHQNFGRFLGFAAAKSDVRSFYILNLLWLAWPVVLPASTTDMVWMVAREAGSKTAAGSERGHGRDGTEEAPDAYPGLFLHTCYFPAFNCCIV
jgi:4-amino-4-deoxy-L-arabinose transferase-like glycosyltransferase